MNGFDERDDLDTERLLRDALDAQARAAVPDHRHPPAIDWPEPERRRPSWVAPLSVAAAVIVLAGGVGLVASHRGATTLPTPADSTGAPTSASPSPTSTKVPTQAGPTSGAAGTATPGSPTSTGTATGGFIYQSVAGASIAVPAGWTLTTEANGSSNTRCIVKDGAPSPSSLTKDSCTVRITWSTTPGHEDADTPGGYRSNPEFCDPTKGGVSGQPLVDYTDTTFGGRAAEYRRWSYVCADGSPSTNIVQYQVLTPVSWVVYSTLAGQTGVKEVVDAVAAHSTLPPETSTTRVYDAGILTSVVPQVDGSTVIQIDRVIAGEPNRSSVVYTYRVPANVYPPAGLVAAVKTLIAVDTDGRLVTSVTLPGG